MKISNHISILLFTVVTIISMVFTWNVNSKDYNNQAQSNSVQVENQFNSMMMPPACSGSMDTIGGFVWEDYDNDGVKDVGEITGVADVIIQIFDENDAQVGINDTTDADGNWAIDVSGVSSSCYTLRVEFSNLPIWAHVTKKGTDNGTKVQFAAPGSCASLGVIDPSHYCQSNPRIVVPCYVNGTNNTTSPRDAIVSWEYNASGNTGATKQTHAYKDQIGSTWGLSYSRTRQRLYASAFLKRHVGLGSGGLGGIYVVDPTSGTPNGTLFTTIPNAGTIASNAARGLGNPANPSRDPTAFGLLGRMGLGDMDISPDEQFLYVVNLNDRQIYIVDIENPGTSHASVPIPDPSCNGGVAQPFGLKVYRNNLYVGVICDASILGMRSDLRASVFVMDLSTNTFSGGSILDFPLDYLKSSAWNEPFYSGANVIAGGEAFPTHSTRWYPWADVYSGLTFNRGENAIRYSFCHPTPMFTDIEFDQSGNMILGFSDRTAHQFFSDNQLPFPEGADKLVTIVSGGDILRAINNSGTYQIEPLSTMAVQEFFDGEVFPGHGELAQGGLIHFPGRSEVLTTALDPITINTGGIIKLSLTTGGQTGPGYEVFGNSVGFALKGIGLADLEARCDPLPPQIGNYVWIDDNHNGVQDACESSLSNVPVSLYNKAGNLVATTQSDLNGEYYFSGSGDPDETWLIGNALQLDSTYFLVFGDSVIQSSEILIIDGQNYVISNDSTGSGMQPYVNDSDPGNLSNGLPGSIPDGLPYLCYSIGDSTNHDLDLGLVPLSADLALCMIVDTMGTNSSVDFDTDLNNLSFGDTIKFQIKLFNQGDSPVDSLHITDYIPSGLSFITDTLLGGLNDGWTAANLSKPTYRWGGEVLDTAQSDTICIYLKLEMPTILGDSIFTNIAEISFAQDTNGTDISMQDIDSDLDNNPYNNGGSLPMTAADDYINGDAKGAMNTTPDGVDSTDQDNVDPAKLTIADLALVEKLDPTFNPVGIGYGDSIKILIDVTNQGNVIADSVKLTNYIPSGFSFDPLIATNSEWMVMNDSVVMVWLEDIAAGAKDSICIYLTVEPDPGGETSWVNETEISEMIDTSGNNVNDIDSPLDDDPNNNVGGQPESPADDEENGDGTAMGPDGVDSTDQDNADPVLFRVVDLALCHQIDTTGTESSLTFTTDLNDLNYGDTLKFRIKLFNQGNVPVDSLSVTNYLPAGLVFIDDVGMGGLNEGWNGVDAMNPVYSWHGTTLSQNESDTICIYTVLAQVLTPDMDSWTSHAEISSAGDTSGTMVSNADFDYPLNNNPADNVGGRLNSPADDYLLGDGSATIPDGVDSTDQDSEDPAAPQVCDLALFQVLDTIPPLGFFTEGDTVKYLIKIVNQGNGPVKNITILDSIPCGYNWLPGLNSNWMMQSSTNYIYTGFTDTLLPGTTDSIPVYLQIKFNTNRLMDCNILDNRQLDNYTEIAGFEDLQNTTKDDIDSNPLSHTPEEDAVIPNLPGDNDIHSISNDSLGSEDDSDFANINFFDLALINQIDSTFDPGPFVYGDTVKFLMQVINQGNIPVDSIALVNYLMDGMEYDPNYGDGIETNNSLGWTDLGGGVLGGEITGNILDFKEIDTICIYLRLKPSIMPNAFVDYAEILEVRDTLGAIFGQDVDSDYDNSKINDGGGAPNTPTDDQIFGIGTLGANIPLSEIAAVDEDDQDPALVEIVDFALIEEIVTAGPYKYGDTVKYQITVFNQGNATADVLEISNYIPTGLTYVADSNNTLGWILINDSTAEFTFRNLELKALEDTAVCIYFIPRPDTTVEGWTNYSEISHAEDSTGRDLDDLDGDSPLNSDRMDNPGGLPNSPADDETFGDGTGTPGSAVDSTDQDNHDPAHLKVFDLALIEVVDSSFVDIPNVAYFDTIKFIIKVFNQGNEPALSTTINNYIPEGYVYINDPVLNQGWSPGNPAIFSSIDSLGPQTDTSLCIYLQLIPVVNPIGMNPFVDYAEIGSTLDTTGMIPVDFDSEPNSDLVEEKAVLPGQPGDNDLKSIHTDSLGSQDDHDPAEISVFDLALIMFVDTNTTDQQTLRYQDSVKFIIKLYNQGGVDAKNIKITNYVSDGFSFDVLENPGWIEAGNQLMYTYVDTLPTWEVDSICLILHVQPVAQIPGSPSDSAWLSISEITTAQDPTGMARNDIDSQSDNNQSNDPGGKVGTPDDNNTSGNGKKGEDEDDSDPALVRLYDLALIMTTDATTVVPGDTVTFKIRIINQGSFEANQINVVNYVPESFEFIDDIGVNPAWFPSGMTPFTFIDSLNANEDTCVYIKLLVLPNITEFGLVNFAEITGSSEHEMGQVDADSDPGNNPGMYDDNPDPNGGDPFGPSDNEVRELAIFGGDSDDHDGAFVVVCRPFICGDKINVSLDGNCEFLLHPAMFLKDFPVPAPLVEWTIKDGYGRVFHDPLLTDEHRGQCLEVSISIPECGSNSCWMNVCVDDHTPPSFSCENDTINCYDPLPPLPDVGASCTNAPEIHISMEDWQAFDCDENREILGVLTQIIRLKDAWNRSSTCTREIYLRRDDINNLVCPDTAIIDCCEERLDPVTNTNTVAILNDFFTKVDEFGRRIPKPVIDENGKSIGLVDPPYLVDGMDTTYLWPHNARCEIVANYEDHIIPTCGPLYKIKRKWLITDWCTGIEQICIQWIKVVDIKGPQVDTLPVLYPQFAAHNCQGKVTISRPDISNECAIKLSTDPREAESKIKVFYELTYLKPGHPGAKEILFGELKYDETTELSLPPGEHLLHYTLQDDCGNQSGINQRIVVRDDIGPTPVCDRITTTTPDPGGCWSRISAEDLDDGSFDNCCDSLHFAVAKMTDIDYWTNYWVEAYKVFYGENYYLSNQAGIESEIEHWIECYLFNDYVELTDCGSEMVVLRVYEACGMPQYDPHQFAGSKHNWYCFQVYDDFACYLRLHYDEVSPTDIPRMDLLKASLAKGVDGPVYGSEPNPLDCEYVLASDLDQWVKIQADYPEMVNLSNSRMTFPHHWSQCMVEVLKEDKVAPVVTTAGDVTVYCDGVPLSIANSFVYPGSCDNPVSYPWLGGTNGYYGGPSVGQYATCDSLPWGIQGRYVVDGYNWRPVYCRAWLLMDVYDSPGGRPKFEFGTPVIKDNCTPLDSLQQRELDSGSLNECGVGTMHRVWTVTDRCGNVGTGGQRITTLPRSDFEVIFPTDIEILCNEVMDLSPEGMGGLPIVSDDECELVGINYHDERLNIVEDGCYKILRIWTLVDWCIYEGEQLDRNPDYIVNDSLRAGTNRPCVIRSLKDNGDGYMKYIQVIKVQDQEEPEFTGRTDTVFCSYNENCEPLEISLNLGEGRDNCSRDIRYSYTVYDNMENEVASGTGNELTGVFDLGIYTVAIRIGDGCGNAVTDTVQFAVNDCKAPGVYCTGEIITVIMDTVGSVEVDASIFDLGTLDNCTPQEDLYIGYDDFTTSKVFTCADIPNGISQLIPLTVIFMDEGGNIGSCNVTLNLQDGVGPPCTDAPNLVQLSGKIDIESGEGVEYAEVSVTEMGMVKTDVDGRYAVHNAIFGNRCEVRPERNDDPLNGVSTLDLVLIQKHVLGTELLSSPYKLIAADVNDSKQISALDIVELRKMILGTSTEFEHNMSWRFVDKNYVFPSPQQPWEYPESIKLQDMQVEEMDDLDFVGVKIGDVNGNVKANGLMEVEIREEREKMWFEVDELEYTAGETYEISFYGSAFEDMVGFQGTMELLNLEVLGISRSGLEFDETNVGWRWAASGMFTLSWHDESGVTLDQEEELFTLRVRATADGKLSESMKVHSRYTPAEAYHSDYTPIDVGVRFRRGNELIEHQSFKLYQNIPNPFFSYTTIGFELPRTDVGILRILDMRGKLLYEYEGGFASGYNEVRIDSKSINSATGVLYYQLETQDHVALKKMIRVR